MKLIEIEHYNDWSNIIFANQDKTPGLVAVMIHIKDDDVLLVSEDSKYEVHDSKLYMMVPDDFDDSEQFRNAAYIIPKVAGGAWMLEHMRGLFFKAINRDNS